MRLKVFLPRVLSSLTPIFSVLSEMLNRKLANFESEIAGVNPVTNLPKVSLDIALEMLR